MDKKISISIICGVVVIAAVATYALIPHHHKHMPDMIQNKPMNEFIVDGGPMMPPAHMEPFPGMGPGPMFGPHHGPNNIDDLIKLSGEQRDKLKKLDEALHRDMKALHDEEDEVRESYLEKMDAVLTAEQFRTIQKMRNDLRRDVKKLKDKQFNTLEKHRHSFESILTPEQKNMLEQHHGQKHKQSLHEGVKETGFGPHKNKKTEASKTPKVKPSSHRK